MTDPLQQQIAALQQAIAALQQAIPGLSALPDTQRQLQAQLAEKQRQLTALTGQVPPQTGSTTIHQTGGVNFGVGNTISQIGDIVGGDKIQGDKVGGNKYTVGDISGGNLALGQGAQAGTISGPVIHGNITSGRDTNIATTQTIVNNDRFEPLPPSPPPPTTTPVPAAPGPELRLVLTDLQSQPLDALTVGEEATLRLEVEQLAGDYPDTTLEIEVAGAGIDWAQGSRRSLRLQPGQAARLPRWSLIPEQAGALTLRALVLAGGTLVQHLALTVVCHEPGGLLTGAAVPLAQPAPAALLPARLDLAALAAKPQRATSVTLVFTQETRDYRLLLLDGSATSWSLNLPLTEHSIAELLATTRAELEDIVGTRQGMLKVYQQAAPDIPEDVAQRSLIRLANLGAYLCQKLFDAGGRDAQALSERLMAQSQAQSLALTIAADHLPIPWQLLYDRDPRAGVDINGFWGFRHILTAQPTSRRSMATGSLPFGPACTLHALAAYNLPLDDKTRPRSVIAEQRQTFAALGVAAQEANDEPALEAALAAGTDAALLYLYCHMLSQSPDAAAVGGGPAGVGGTRIILTEAKNALTLQRLERAAPLGSTPLLRSGPLVVLNACGSADLSPLTYDGLAPYLLDQGARAIIGTVADTPISFGATFGPALLRAIIADRLPVGEALLRVRRQFWEQHRNPLGLLYTLYGSPDLRVTSDE